MDEKLVRQVLLPFLTLANRNQPWAMDEEYKEYALKEHNSKMFLTSIGYKEEWAYKDFEKYVSYMSDGRTDYFAIALPYQFGIEAGIISQSRIESTVREANGDTTDLKMEYEVIPHGQSESPMFQYDQINNSRKLLIPLIPPTNEQYISVRGDLRKLDIYQEKGYGEIRVISMDIAISAGRKNDNTVFTVFRLTNRGEYYDKEISYIETMNGVNLDPQILRLKQLFYDLECDYVVVDAGGAIGIQAVATCGQITRDIIRNKHYPGWRTCDKVDKFDMRVADQNAVPVLYAMQVSGAGSDAKQYNMLVGARVEFDRGHIFMLQRREQAIDELNQRYKYMKLKTSNNFSDVSIAENMTTSFVNTDELVKECIETQMIEVPRGYRFDEKNGRKDRVISMLYGLFFIAILEEDLYVRTKAVDVSSYFNNNDSSNMNKTSSKINPFINSFSRLKRNNFGRR